jgi:lipase
VRANAHDGGVRLHVQEWGEPRRPVVVALHGVSGSSDVFNRLARPLTDRYRIVGLDLRGHGRSDKEPPWDIPTHLADIADTLDAAGIDRAPVMGFSFGGRLAVELAARHPARVERLVLLDPALQIPPSNVHALADAARNDVSWASVDEAVAARRATGIAPYAPQGFWDDWALSLGTAPDGRVRWLADRNAVVTIYSELATAPPSFALCRLPTLLITGAESALVQPAHIAAYRDALGDLLTVLSVRAKHQVIGDALDEVYPAVASFLAQPTV